MAVEEKTVNAERKFLFEANGESIFNMQLAQAIPDRRGIMRQLAPIIRESASVS
jgi:hypothetical protein